MAREFISIRGLSLLLFGMAGWLIGSYLLNSGVQTWETPLYSSILFMICFFAILAGVALWGYDVLLRSRNSPGPGSGDEGGNPPLDTTPRENKSLSFAAAGTLLSLLVINHAVDSGPLISRSIWLYTGVYCAIAIAGFSLFYLPGYYLLFKSG